MSTSMSVRLQGIASELAGSAFQLAAEVRSVVEQKLAPMLQAGENMPDLELFQQLVGRYLKAQGSKAVAVDVRHKKARVASRNVSALRRELMKKLRQRLRDVRYHLDRQFGPEVSRRLIEERNFSRPDVGGLVKLARQALEILREPQYAWTVIDPGLSTTSADLANAMEVEIQQLQEILDGASKTQKRERQIEQRLKGEELVTVHKDNVAAGSVLAGLYNFAGLPFHAQRLRLKSRKSAAGPAEETKPTPEEKPAGEVPSPADGKEEVS